MRTTETNIDIALYERFGEDFDRFRFPADIFKVTSGRGGEALLIIGSEKIALYDCGMAYCGEQTADNIAEVLKQLKAQGRIDSIKLDYILLSHSHYDHIGGLPYILERFPEAVVFGSEKCQNVLSRENARKLIRELGEEARALYTPGNNTPLKMDPLKVDVVMGDGDTLSLGKETIIAYETKGHTDCSLSYYLDPPGLLFTSESTGILEGDDYVHTPCLKSFLDSVASSYKCESLHPVYICLSHFGMIPQEMNKEYFALFRKECQSKIDYVDEMMRRGLSQDEMLANYLVRYWTPLKESEQPYEAFRINSGHILKALIRAVEEGK